VKSIGLAEKKILKDIMSERTNSQVQRRFDEILTTSEVAAELRCSKAHVYNAINGKVAGVSRLPAIHMGRRKLVRRTALEAWKCENEISGGGILGPSSEMIDAVEA
jgi:excisionase family DNA binding protein